MTCALDKITLYIYYVVRHDTREEKLSIYIHTTSRGALSVSLCHALALKPKQPSVFYVESTSYTDRPTDRPPASTYNASYLSYYILPNNNHQSILLSLLTNNTHHTIHYAPTYTSHLYIHYLVHTSGTTTKKDNNKYTRPNASQHSTQNPSSKSVFPLPTPSPNPSTLNGIVKHTGKLKSWVANPIFSNKKTKLIFSG